MAGPGHSLPVGTELPVLLGADIPDIGHSKLSLHCRKSTVSPYFHGRISNWLETTEVDRTFVPHVLRGLMREIRRRPKDFLETGSPAEMEIEGKTFALSVPGFRNTSMRPSPRTKFPR